MPSNKSPELAKLLEKPSLAAAEETKRQLIEALPFHQIDGVKEENPNLRVVDEEGLQYLVDCAYAAGAFATGVSMEKIADMLGLDVDVPQLFLVAAASAALGLEEQGSVDG